MTSPRLSKRPRAEMGPRHPTPEKSETIIERNRKFREKFRVIYRKRKAEGG